MFDSITPDELVSKRHSEITQAIAKFIPKDRIPLTPHVYILGYMFRTRL